MEQIDIDVLCDAVRKFGRDKMYRVMFGASTVLVTVYHRDTLIAELWSDGTSTQVKVFTK